MLRDSHGIDKKTKKIPNYEPLNKTLSHPVGSGLRLQPTNQHTFNELFNLKPQLHHIKLKLDTARLHSVSSNYLE